MAHGQTFKVEKKIPIMRKRLKKLHEYHGLLAIDQNCGVYEYKSGNWVRLKEIKREDKGFQELFAFWRGKTIDLIQLSRKHDIEINLEKRK